MRIKVLTSAALCFFFLLGTLIITTSGICSQPGRAFLLDDFERGSLFNYKRGELGGDTKEPGVCKFSFTSDSANAYGYKGTSLKLDYDVSRSGTYSMCWTKLGPKRVNLEGTEYFDIGKHTYLSFYVKGEHGGENFKVKLHEDTNGDHLYTYGQDIESAVEISKYLKEGITTQWQKVVIPLNNFRYIKNRHQILELLFIFENNLKQTQAKGTVYIDNLILGIKPAYAISKKEDIEYSVWTDSDIKLGDNANLKLPLDLKVKIDQGIDFNALENIQFFYKHSEEDKFISIGYDYDLIDHTYETLWQDMALSTKGTYSLFVQAEYSNGQKSEMLSLVEDCKLTAPGNEDLLNSISRGCLAYFLDYQDPDTGLIADNSDGGYASIASTGFGIAAIAIGAERGWIAKEEAKVRINKALDMFLPENPNHVENKDGFFYHFVDMQTGARGGDCEISVVDTALLICGAFMAGEYFGGDIKRKSLKIYENINWKAFFVKDKNIFSMGWIPEKGYLKSYWNYFTDEVIIITLLAISSPSSPVDPSAYYAFKREKGSYKDLDPFIYSFNGALFCHQYAHMWFDFSDKVDSQGVNWQKNSYLATLSNRKFCIDNAAKYKTYGPDSWCISSFYLPEAYTMHFGTSPCGAKKALHDGTVATVGAAASVVFTPKTSFLSVKSLLQKYPKLWGYYGLRNSFNLDRGFYAPIYYGIDRGLMMLMLENFRDGIGWKYFMKNEYIQKAMEKAGFSTVSKVSDLSSIRNDYQSKINSLKAQISQVTTDQEKATLYYQLADTSIEYLAKLRKDDLTKFREYFRSSEAYYENALQNIEQAVVLAKDKNLVADCLLNKLIIYKLSFFDDQKLKKIYQDLHNILKSQATVIHTEKYEIFADKLTLYGLINEANELYKMYLNFIVSSASINPQLVDSLGQRSEKFLEEKEYEKASLYYDTFLKVKQKILTKDKFVALKLRVADAYFKHQLYTYAITLYKEVITKYDDYPEKDYYLYQLSDSLFKNQDVDEAEVYYNKLINKFPKSSYSSKGIFPLIELSLKNGKRKKIIALLKTFLENNESVEKEDYLLYQLGCANFITKDYKEAAISFDQLVQKYPDSNYSKIGRKYLKRIKK